MPRTTPQAPPITFDRSAWERTAVAAPQTEALSRDRTTKVAIIGAGYMGLTAALKLAAQNVDAVVFDADGVGFGASGRNGGQVVPGLKHDPDTLEKMTAPSKAKALIAFAGATADRTFDLIRTYQLRCDAQQNGWIQPARTQGQLRTVTRRAAQWRTHAGIAPRLLDAKSVQALTGTTGYVGGWVDARGGQLQPLSYARELARVAMEAGAEIHTNSRVTSLARDPRGWRLGVNGFEVLAERVIVATNAYADQLVPNLRRSIIAANSIQTATAPLPAALRRSILPAGLPVSDARRLLNYFRFDPAGRFLIGARGSFGARQPERYFTRLRDAAIELFPALREARWETSWGGPFAVTVDHLPHIHAPAPGLYVGAGCNGRGVALASQLGPMLAQLCAGASSEDLPIPVTDLSPIPFHVMRRPVSEAVAGWYRLLDRIDV